MPAPAPAPAPARDPRAAIDARWDRTLVTSGLAALRRAERCGRPGGPYVAQAAIAACHARAPTPQDTDWIRIAALYAALGRLAPSPVVEVNRAVAVSYAFGPAPALAIVDALRAAALTRNARERALLLDHAAAL